MQGHAYYYHKDLLTQEQLPKGEGMLQLPYYQLIQFLSSFNYVLHFKSEAH